MYKRHSTVYDDTVIFLKRYNMKTIQDVDTVLIETKRALFLAGINMDKSNANNISKSWSSHAMYCFNVVFIYCCVGGQIHFVIDGIKSGKSLTDLSLVAPCALYSTLGTVKTICLFYKRENIFEVVQIIKDLQPKFHGDTINESQARQKAIFAESVDFFQIVNKTLLIIISITTTCFAVLPLFSMYLEYRKTGVVIKELPFLVKYFFDPYVSPMYYLVYAQSSVAAAMVSCNVYGSDALFYFFGTYIQMHFRVLGVRLENVIEENNDENVDKKLKGLIHYHFTLVRITEKMKSLYSVSILFNFIAVSILICLSGFNIMFSDDLKSIITFVFFLVLNLLQILMLCYFGDMIMRESMDLVNAVYKSLWYYGNQKCKKTLLIILIRAQKPCKLTAADFADINLSAFSVILSRSWSYFAVLKTMYN